MLKINYIHEVLLSDWNTSLSNLIILKPQLQRKILKINPVHIETLPKTIWMLLSRKNNVVLRRLSNLFGKMVC